MGECFLLTGIPGTGKSYYIVNRILSKEIQDNYIIFHNIDGLKPEKFDNPAHVIDFTTWEMGPFRDYFNPEKQKELSEHAQMEHGKKILWVIDEAHKPDIGMGKKEEAVLHWLAYHRHYGQQIWITTQNKPQVAKCYRDLCEYEIRAKGAGAFKNPWVFVYTKYSTGGTGCGNIFLRLKKDIFASYKSEIVQGNRGYKYTAFIFLACLTGAGYFYFCTDTGPKTAQAAIKKEKPQETKIQNHEKGPGQVNNKKPALDAEKSLSELYSFAGMVPAGPLLQRISDSKLLKASDLFPNGFQVVKASPLTIFAEKKIHIFTKKTCVRTEQKQTGNNPIFQGQNQP